MSPRAPESGPAPRRGWTRQLRSHLLQFAPPPAVELGARACNLLILAAVSLELLRVLALEWMRPGAPLGLLLPGLLAAVLLGMPAITGMRWRQLGLRPWREWSVEQKWYCGQVLVLAATAFLVMLSGPAGPPRSLATVFLPYLCYGFSQELIYCGMLQTALVRRADVRRDFCDRAVLWGALPEVGQSVAAGQLPRGGERGHRVERAWRIIPSSFACRVVSREHENCRSHPVHRLGMQSRGAD